MPKHYKKKNRREDTTSGAVAQGTPMAFSKAERGRRRKDMAAEMTFFGIQAEAVVETDLFDHLAVVWESIRDHLDVWAGRITEQVKAEYKSVGDFKWTGEVKNEGRGLIVDFATEKNEKCLTPWIVRAVVEYHAAADTFEGSFYMVNGHGKPVFEHDCQFGRKVMECGPPLPAAAFASTASVVGKDTNPNVPHDPSRTTDISTSQAMQIVRGKSARDMVMGHGY